MEVNKELEKIEQDARSILALMPKEGVIKLKKRFLFFEFNKIYKLRPYSLFDKKILIEKYGDKALMEIFLNPVDVRFELIHCEIVYNAMTEKDRRDFKSYDNFLKRLSNTAKQIEVILAGLNLRGAATNPKMTEQEMKEALDEIKEDVKKKEMKTPT